MATINWTLEHEENGCTYEFVIEYELIPGERPCKTHNGVAHQLKNFDVMRVRIISEQTDTDWLNVGPGSAFDEWMHQEYSEQIEAYILDRLV